MSIEAMKLVRDAIEQGVDLNLIGAKHILDQAIAEAEKHSATHGEPVAVMQLHTDGWDLIEGIDTDWLETLPFGTTLYTHSSVPQGHEPKREWVGLTDEEILDLYSQFDWDIVTGWEYERAIEAKLKEKNT